MDAKIITLHENKNQREYFYKKIIKHLYSIAGKMFAQVYFCQSAASELKNLE